MWHSSQILLNSWCFSRGGHRYITTKSPANPGFAAMSLFRIPKLRCRQNSIAAKWNIFLSFGLKVPFGFPCFAHVCLESWLGLVFFSTAYVTLVVALLFGGLVLLLAFLQGFFNRFLSLRCSTVTLLEAGALACFYEWMDSVSDFATYAWLHFLPGQSTCCKF